MIDSHHKSHWYKSSEFVSNVIYIGNICHVLLSKNYFEYIYDHIWWISQLWKPSIWLTWYKCMNGISYTRSISCTINYSNIMIYLFIVLYYICVVVSLNGDLYIISYINHDILK